MDKTSGMNAHKVMAGAGGSFSVSGYPGKNGVAHPDLAAGTGEKGAMGDGERGIGMPVGRGKNSHPAQAHPDHGPAHDNWSRG